MRPPARFLPLLALWLLSAQLFVFAIAPALAASALRATPDDHSSHQAAGAAATREIELTAAPARWEIQPGLVVDAWAYNGQVPGPEVRVREGERVRIHLRNRLPVPTTIHWHGIDVPLGMDGVPGISQPVVPPGGDFTYEFVATNPGTRWYHTHVSENFQQELGLYGALIVEPRTPEPTRYDAEYTYLLDEKALDITPEVALGRAQVRDRESGNGRGGLFAYDLFLLNGKAGDAIPPMRVAAGQRILVRLINAGNLPHAMHLHGQSFRIVATDGNPVPEAARLLKDTVLIGPGERYDLEVHATNPGIWLFHCHMPNHMENGMMTALIFEGFEVPAGHAHGHGSEAPVPAATPAPGGSAPAPAASPATSQAVTVSMLDDRYDPPVLTVPVGATVEWINRGVNLHTATALDGSFDSGTLVPGATFSFTFTAPGTYRYYCRQHLLGGMLGTIVVQ